MSARGRGGWWRLVGVAVLMASAMLLAGFTALMVLHAVTWTMWDPSGDEPLWLTVLTLAVVVLLAAVPGAAVGLAAGLRRWWVVAAMAMSALVPALVVLTPAGDVAPFVVVPGMVAGPLLAVALADRLGCSDPGRRDVAAGRPMRSREDRVIAGVCGGWARAHGREPVLVRVLVGLLCVVLAVTLRQLALAVLAYYVFAWLTWPREPTPTPTAPSAML